MKYSNISKLRSTRWRLLSGIPPRYAHLSSFMLVGAAAGAMMLTTSHRAEAWNIYSGSYDNTGLEINLNTTAEYSTIYRVNDPSDRLLNDPNADDGDRNFRHGFVSNEFEVQPVFDVKYGDYGFHVSGEAYLNTLYLQKNQNNSPGTFNPISTTDNRSFTSATVNENGRNAKLLDAFVYGSQYFGPQDTQQLTVKIGRQTLLWGQSLLIPTDGISAGQAPIDIQQAQNNPDVLAQELYLPVGQAVVTYQPNQTYTLQGYYQFEWQPDNFSGVGSYFSSADVLDKGGQRYLLGQGFGLPPQALGAYRVKDNRPPSSNGQFGLSLQATYGSIDTGLFFERYDSKTPVLELGPANPAQSSSPSNIASYWLLYPRDIQLYGASLSTDVGPVNVAGEFSYRRNVNLDGSASAPTYPSSANAGALYPVGQVINAQVSALYTSGPLPLDPNGLTFYGEVVGNSVVAIDRNKAELTPGRQATAAQFATQIVPTYFFRQIPNVQFNIPITLTEGLFNRSQFDASENHGVGTVSVGLEAVYRQTWDAQLTYKDYFGAANPAINGDADRGYLAFFLEHTF